MKICTRCEIEQPLENFSFSKRETSETVSQCKKCVHDYYVDNKEQIDKVSAQYYQKHRIEKLEKQRILYRLQHPKQIKDLGWQPLVGRHADIERQIRQYALSH